MFPGAVGGNRGLLLEFSDRLAGRINLLDRGCIYVNSIGTRDSSAVVGKI